MSNLTEENKEPLDSLKQMLIVRSDLNMSRGELMVMAAHASVSALINQGRFTLDQEGYRFEFREPMNVDLLNWMQRPFTKVALKVSSLEEMDNLYEKAEEAGLLTAYFANDGVPVSIAIGPAKASLIDPLTEHLKLW